MKANCVLKRLTAALISACVTIQLFVVTGISTVNAANFDVTDAFNSWQEAYRAELLSFESSELYVSPLNDGSRGSSFTLYDLNNDDIPELIINTEPVYLTANYIYTFYDSKVVLLACEPLNPSIYYCPDEQIIDLSGMSGQNHFSKFSKIVNDKLETIDVFNQSPDPETKQICCVRNGKKISEEEYSQYIGEYKAKEWEEINIWEENKFSDLTIVKNNISYNYYFDYYEASFYNGFANSLTIPSKINGLPVSILGQNLLSDNSTVKTLNLSENVINSYIKAFNCDSLENIVVSSSNPDWTSKNGILYSKDMTRLVKYPPAKDTSSYTIPSSVLEIGTGAFSWCTKLKQITIPETVGFIDVGAFFWCPNLSSVTILNSDCHIDFSDRTICNSYSNDKGKYLGVIKGYEGSTAQEFADYYDITFISLGEDPAKTTTTTTTTTTTSTTTKNTTTTTIRITTTSTTTKASPSNNNPIMVILGDGIASGCLLNGNVEHNYGEICGDYLGCKVSNYAVSGDNTGDLIKVIDKLSDEQKQKVANADYIVISIGGNDIMQFASKKLISYAADKGFLNDGYTKNNLPSEPSVSDMIEIIKFNGERSLAEYASKGLSQALEVNSRIGSIATDLYSSENGHDGYFEKVTIPNVKTAVTKLKAISPDARILVQNIYQPVELEQTYMESTYGKNSSQNTLINSAVRSSLETVMAEYDKQLHTIDGIEVVDVKTLFTSTNETLSASNPGHANYFIDIQTGELSSADVHPNQKGHVAIATAVLAQINKLHDDNGLLRRTFNGFSDKDKYPAIALATYKKVAGADPSLITTKTSTTTITTTKRTTTSTTTTTTTTTKRTTATTTTRKVTSTTPSSTTTSRIMLGDVTVDGKIDAVDASYIMRAYVISSTSGKKYFDYERGEIAADVDGNGRIDSCDASYVLLYYAYYCTNKLFNLQDIQSYKTDSPNVDVTLSLTQKKLTYDEVRSSPIIEIILSAKSANATKFDSTGIHIKIDSGLELVQTEYMAGHVWAVPQRRFFTSEAVQDGTDGLFLAFANDEPEVAKADGLNLWSFGVKVKNPEPGKKYPIQIAYSDGDLFDNCLSNDTEKLRENAFSHIEQGYIEIIDSPQTTTSKATTTTTTTTTAKPTTTTSTAQKTTTITTTTVNGEFKLEVTSITIKNGDQYTIPINREDVVFKSTNPDIAVVSPKGVVTAIGTGEAIINVIDKDYNVIQLKVSVQSDVAYLLGDVNNDGQINAVDASTVLSYYAMISTNKDGGFDDKQKAAADVNKDGLINAVDASCILSYYAYISTTKEAVVSMEEYTNSNKWEKAYQDKLQEFMNSDAFGTIAPNDSMFDLKDITGDNIPELFISVGTYHAATVHAYSFLNGKIIELFDGGEYGLLSYIPSESYLYENVSYAPGPDRSIDSLLKVYKYDGKTITKVIEFGDNVRGMNNYFTIDGTEVDKNKYYNEKEKYNLPSISLGRNYLFDSVNINNISKLR